MTAKKSATKRGAKVAKPPPTAKVTKKRSVAKVTKKRPAASLTEPVATPAARRTEGAPASSRGFDREVQSCPPSVPSSRPSDRAMAVSAQLPLERALTHEEGVAMARCAQTALSVLAVDGGPALVVARISAYLEEVRAGRSPQPTSQDVRLGMGVLWGEQVRAQAGWRWVHLSYPNGFASYALVPEDRAFACFPLNRLSDLLQAASGAGNTSVALFEAIRAGALPRRRDNAYLVIG
jgi:hypothetical protein